MWACRPADNMEIDADKDDTDMAEAAPAADEEPEVQSPLKKAPKPETDDAGNPAAEPDKPSTAAASGGAPSTKALAAGKRKGLTVAKAATGERATVVAFSLCTFVLVQLAWGQLTTVLGLTHVPTLTSCPCFACRP